MYQLAQFTLLTYILIAISGCASVLKPCEHNLDLTSWKKIYVLPDDFVKQEPAWNDSKQTPGWSAHGGTWYAEGELMLANCKKTPKSSCPDEVTKFTKRNGIWVSNIELICVN